MAKYLFDTCSLIALVRYYLPFDINGKLKDFIYKGFTNKEFIMLKQVKDECEWFSKGLVFNEFPNLKKINSVPFGSVPKAEIHNLIDKKFVVPLKRKQLADSDYESQKHDFINGADFNLIYYAMQDKNKVAIITEETPTNNDNKLFKKIPAICQMQEIECISISQLLQTRLDIDFTIKSTMENINSL